MVLIKRRSTISNIPITSIIRGRQLPYGDNNNLTPRYKCSVSPKYSTLSPDSLSPESGTKARFSFDRRPEKPHVPKAASLPPWMYWAILTTIAVWCLGSQYFWPRRRPNSQHISPKEWEQYRSLNSIPQVERPKFGDHPHHHQHVTMIQRNFQIYSEGPVVAASRFEPSVVSSPTNEQEDAKKDAKKKNVSTKEPKITLATKIQNLQKYIQDESRRHIYEKYGPGPTYHVKFTVELIKTKSIQSFVIEMAPLNLVPHSVHVFLEMVDHGLWDDTVFWHHDNIDHVLSAATVAYKTGAPKHQHFDALGLCGVSFAEYSPLFPHNQYTVGFAHKGPGFYINTQNNTELHGPGGQGHHDFPDEADPCFGKVVQGFDVVDKMYQLSLQRAPWKGEGKRQWHENDLTHIISAEILARDK